MQLSNSANVDDNVLNRRSAHRTRIRSIRGLVLQSAILANARMQADTVEKSRYCRAGQTDDAPITVSRTGPWKHGAESELGTGCRTSGLYTVWFKKI